MRVLFLVNHHLGWKTLAHHLAEQAAARPHLRCEFRRFEATVLQKIVTRRIPVLRRSMTTQTRLWSRYVERHLGAELRSGKFDVIVCMGQSIAHAVLRIVDPEQVPVAVFLDTTGMSFARELMNNGAFNIERASEELAVYEQCRLLLPWSNWASRSLVNDYQIAESRILVCPPSGNFNGFSPKGNSPTLPRVVFVGNDFERKGGPELVRWHQQRLSAMCELHIFSAKTPRRLNGPNLFCHGAIDNARLTRDVLPAASVFCLPTRHDMSPYALVEAQLAGLPCVSSNLAGIPEIVVHEQTGLLADRQDEEGFITAVAQLCVDARLRDRMGRNASERSRELLNSAVTYGRMFERLADLVG